MSFLGMGFDKIIIISFTNLKLYNFTETDAIHIEHYPFKDKVVKFEDYRVITNPLLLLFFQLN